MKRIFVIVAFCLVALATFSCKKGYESSYWGSTKFYKPFLWSKCPADTLTKTLVVEFNDDAKESLTDPLVLALYRVDLSGAKQVTPNEAEVFVNGKLSEDNTISLYKDCSGAIQISVILSSEELLSSDRDRDYRFFFKVIHNPGLDRINDLEVVGKKTPLMDNDAETPILIHINQIPNKLMVGTCCAIFAILAAFCIVLILCRLNNPSFRVKRLYLTNENMQRMVSLKGAGRVIFSNKKQKQSFFQRLFTRRTIFVLDEFFSNGDVRVDPKFRINTEFGKRDGVRFSVKNYDIDNSIIAKDEESTITNLDTNNTIIIKIQ